MSLRPLQSEFLAYLEHGDHKVRARVCADDDLAGKRLDIYYEAYRIRLTDALRDNFPAIHFVLGDDDFFRLGENYFFWRRPTTFTLRDAGDRLADYFAITEPFSAQPVFSDLAAFEWALRNAFDAPDGRHLTVDALKEVAPSQWGDLTFSLHPSVQAVLLSTNAAEVWQALSDESPVPQPANFPPVQWVVWRRDLRTYFRSLSDDESLLFGLLAGGKSFGQICESVAVRWGEGTAQKVASTLGQFINEGWFLSA